jgi:hypothetical protein
LHWLALIGWLAIRPGQDWATICSYLAIVSLLMLSGFIYYQYPPPSMEQSVLYNSIFNGILVDSPSPEEDLRGLGLPTEMSAYAYSTFFSDAAPQRDKGLLYEFYTSASKIGIVEFYLRRPSRLYQVLNRGAVLAGKTRPDLGNFEIGIGFPPKAQSTGWAIWSTIRSKLFPWSLGFVLAVLVCYLCLVLQRWRGEHDIRFRVGFEILLTLPPLLLGHLTLISIFDGISDVTKHAFLFNLLFDFILIATVAIGIGQLIEPPGVRQHS